MTANDTASWLTEPAVIDAARRSDAIVHVVCFEPDPFVDRLVLTAGGRTWSAPSDAQLREAFGQALDEMHARYRLTYVPTGVDSSGWHSVSIALKSGPADIRGRSGYFVAPASR